MSARKRTKKETETRILTQCKRRCALCFGLNNDVDPKLQGQIAHIDRNNRHREEDNLVYLCLHHHDQYDRQPRQSKSLTKGEIMHYRDRLYAYFGTAHPFNLKQRIDQADWSALELLGGHERVSKQLVDAIMDAIDTVQWSEAEIEGITGISLSELQTIKKEPSSLKSSTAILLLCLLNLRLDQVLPFPKLTDKRLRKWRMYFRNAHVSASCGQGDSQDLLGDAALVLMIYHQALKELDCTFQKGGRKE